MSNVNVSFNSKQLKEIEEIMAESLKEFNSRYYNEIGLLKCAISNPIVIKELEAIMTTGYTRSSSNNSKEEKSSDEFDAYEHNTEKQNAMKHKNNTKKKIEMKRPKEREEEIVSDKDDIKPESKRDKDEYGKNVKGKNKLYRRKE